jgi:prevent-host-death family protein
MDVGAYQAKNNLSELLSRVSQDEQITITRHGKPIARLVPVEPVRRRDVRKAIEELKSLARGRHADMSIRDMIAEGRA